MKFSDKSNFNIKRFTAVIFLLIILSCIAAAIFRFNSRDKTYVKIMSDGEVYAEFDLNTYSGENKFEVPSPDGGKNIILVQNGTIEVSDATCPDKLCINQGKRGTGCNNSAPIVCLPNKLSITVKDKNAITDAVTGS